MINIIKLLIFNIKTRWVELIDKKVLIGDKLIYELSKLTYKSAKDF